MTKQDMINRITDRTGISKSRAEIAIDTLFDTVKTALKNGERVELRGFGVFTIKPRKLGVGRNPKTGETTNILPGKSIRFKSGKEFSEI